MITPKHDGNLRLFDAPPAWQDAYGDVLVGLRIFAENALGAQYCHDEHGIVSVLDPETRTLNETGGSTEEFLSLIDSDPDWAIDQEFYRQCVEAHGVVGPHEHFAFIVPIAMGGEMATNNVSRMASEDHMTSLDKLSRQIQHDPVGTQYHPA